MREKNGQGVFLRKGEMIFEAKKGVGVVLGLILVLFV